MAIPEKTSEDSVQKLPENQKQNSKNKRKRRFRWLPFVVAQIFLFVGMASGVWLLHTQNGLHFALLRLPAWFGTSITAQNLEGTLWKGFQASDVAVKTEASEMIISDVAFRWRGNQLWKRRLQIDEIALGDIQIDSKARPPKEKKAIQLPEKLTLPLKINIEKLSVGKVYSDQILLVNALDVAYSYDSHAHSLSVNRLDFPWSVNRGGFSVEARKPFQLSGGLQSSGKLDDIVVASRLRVEGSLDSIRLASVLEGNGIAFTAAGVFNPFAPQISDKIEQMVLHGEGINPQAFLPNLPKAKLDFNATLMPAKGDLLALNGDVRLINHTPVLLEHQGLPLRSLNGSFTVDENGVFNSSGIEVRAAKQGRLLLSGSADTAQQSLNLDLDIHQFTLADVSQNDLSGTLNGNLKARGSFHQPELIWQLTTDWAQSNGVLKIANDVQQAQRTLLWEKGKIIAKNGGYADFSGSLALFQDQKMDLNAHIHRLNPMHLHPVLPEGLLNGDLQLNGELAKNALNAHIQLQQSSLLGSPLNGNAKITYENQRLSQINTEFHLGRNYLNAKGSFGKRGDALSLDVDAPMLQQLGFGLNGSINAKASLVQMSDTWSDVDAKINGQAKQLAIPGVLHAENLDFQLQFSPEEHRPLNLQADGRKIAFADWQVDQINAQINGTLRQHRAQIQAALHADGKPLRLHTIANGAWTQNQQWQGKINALDLEGVISLNLLNPINVDAGSKRVAMSAARWQALGGSLNLEQFIWDKNSGLQTKGRAENLNLSALNAFYTPPVEHDLIVAGDWDFAYGQTARGHLNLRQQGGDVQMLVREKPRRLQNLGLSNWRWRSTFHDNRIQNTFEGNTRYGRADGHFELRQHGNAGLANAALDGKLNLHAVDLSHFRSLLPMGNALRGILNAEILLTGSVVQPQMKGNITGKDLYYRNHDVGVVLADGTLNSRLQGQKWIVDELTFRNGGKVTLKGEAELGENNVPQVDANIVFDGYRLLNQPGRRLAVSGSVKTDYAAQGLMLNGTLKIDEGKFGRQAGTMPTLGEDVQVLGEENEKNNSEFPITMKLALDLNDNVSFNWQGLNVSLGGKLNLYSQPQRPISADGSVYVLKGKYKAYGQNLDISRGVISFVGPLDNPNLNIRAERHGSAVAAGVEILGNLDAPRVSLVANEPMSDKDKLSWLILNRASSGSSSDEAALSTAASAFLVGRLNDKVGLVDDFGLTSSQRRDTETGEMHPAQQVVTFGKQLTQNLYIGYEAGLETASQSVRFVYQLSRAFQGILRAGTESSGGELKYTKRFD